MKLSQQAGMLCGEARFWAFLKEQPSVRHVATRYDSISWTFLRSKEDAAMAVRYILGIESRSDLDSNASAANKWAGLVAEYEQWKGTQP